MYRSSYKRVSENYFCLVSLATLPEQRCLRC